MKKLLKNIITVLNNYKFTILLLILIYFTVSTICRPTLVGGTSMTPTLNDKDFMFINCLEDTSKSLERGDLVVVTINKGDKEYEENIIKRLIGKGGDTVEVRDCKVYVNGKKLKEEYKEGKTLFNPITEETYGKYKVPEGKIFVLGDNREESLDSRMEEVGMIDEADIVGKAYLRIFPFNKISVF